MNETTLLEPKRPVAATSDLAAVRSLTMRTFATAMAAFLLMLPVTLIVPGLKSNIADRYGIGDFWTHSFMAVNNLAGVVCWILIARLCNSAQSRARLAASCAAAVGILFVLMSISENYAVTLLLRSIEGVFHLTALTAVMAIAADLAPANARGRVLGLVGACMMFGSAAGTRLGGAVAEWAPGVSLLLFAGVVALAAGSIMALVLRDPRTRSEADEAKFLSAWRVLRQRPLLASVFLFGFSDRFCVGVIISTLSLFLATQHQLSEVRVSTMMVLFLIPFATLIYPVGRLVVDRFGGTAPMLGGSAAFGLLFSLYGFTPTEWLPVVMVASGVTSALMFTPTLSLCAQLAGPEQRAAAYAGFNAAGSLGMVSGPLVAGAIVALGKQVWDLTTAYRLAFVFAGLMQLLCVALSVWLVFGRRRSDLDSSPLPNDAKRQASAAGQTALS